MAEELSTLKSKAINLSPRSEVDQELLKWARANLKNIPDDENYSKMISGIPYDTFHPTYLARGMMTADKVREYCNMKPESYDPESLKATFYNKIGLLKELFGKTDDILWLAAPFSVDFGFNVSVGKKFYANFNVCFLDSAPIIIGDEVIVGPNTTFVTATHLPDPDERKDKKITYAFPIRVEDNVWIGANVVILPGVTVGKDSTIAAGAVVRENVPPRSIVGGVPAKVLKTFPKRDAGIRKDNEESALGFSLPEATASSAAPSA